VKIIGLAIDLDWIDSAFEGIPKQVIGLVVAKNHFDNTTFSRTDFTENDDV